MALPSLPMHERPEAPGVAGGDQRLGRQEQQRERAHHLVRGWRRSRPRAARGGCARRDAGSPRCRRWTGRSSPPPRARGAGSAAFVRLPLWPSAIGPRWHSIRIRLGVRRPRCRPPSSSGRGRWRGRPPATPSRPVVNTSFTRPMPFSSRIFAPSAQRCPPTPGRGAAARRGPM